MKKYRSIILVVIMVILFAGGKGITSQDKDIDKTKSLIASAASNAVIQKELIKVKQDISAVNYYVQFGNESRVSLTKRIHALEVRLFIIENQIRQSSLKDKEAFLNRVEELEIMLGTVEDQAASVRRHAPRDKITLPAPHHKIAQEPVPAQQTIINPVLIHPNLQLKQ